MGFYDSDAPSIAGSHDPVSPEWSADQIRASIARVFGDEPKHGNPVWENWSDWAEQAELRESAEYQAAEALAAAQKLAAKESAAGDIFAWLDQLGLSEDGPLPSGVKTVWEWDLAGRPGPVYTGAWRSAAYGPNADQEIGNPAAHTEPLSALKALLS